MTTSSSDRDATKETTADARADAETRAGRGLELSQLKGLRRFMAVIIGLATLGCLYFGRELLVPIALAVVIWFLINAMANGLSKPQGARRMPVVLAKLIAVGVIFGLMLLAGNIVARNAAELGQGLDFENSALIQRLRALAASFGQQNFLDAEWLRGSAFFEEFLGELLDYMRGLLSNASLVVLYVLFLLLDEPFFDAKLRALVTDDHQRRDVSETLSMVAREARMFLWLMFLISLGVGLCTFMFCHLFGVPGAGFWGFLAFVLNFIPTLGSILAVLIPGLYALVTLDDPVMLASLLAMLAATQFVAGEVVLPRVMGEHLNLSSFVILFALALWGMLWGPVGLFLAIPITAIFTAVCAKFPDGRPIAIILSKDGQIPDR